MPSRGHDGAARERPPDQPLRGAHAPKPPGFAGGLLVTLEDTIEFFNLVLELKLTADEKRQLLAFLYTL
jgi:hypothetical protein